MRKHFLWSDGRLPLAGMELALAETQHVKARKKEHFFLFDLRNRVRSSFDVHWPVAANSTVWLAKGSSFPQFMSVIRRF